MSVPWGYKLTTSVYIRGPIDEELIEHLVANAVDGFPNVDFVGSWIHVVQDEPKDQVAS